MPEFEKAGIYRPALPSALQDIEGGSFPCYVKSPSRGFHLYFKYTGPPPEIPVLTESVEIKYATHLTVPGSQKRVSLIFYMVPLIMPQSYLT